MGRAVGLRGHAADDDVHDPAHFLADQVGEVVSHFFLLLLGLLPLLRRLQGLRVSQT